MLGIVSSMSNYPHSLIEFQRQFPDENACLRYLEQARWPAGFECPACREKGNPWYLNSRPRVLECPNCNHQISLTSGTIMQRTRQPLQIWFWAAYLMTSQTPGLSALQLQRQLGIRRYETAFLMLHKLRAAMVRPNRDRIGAKWPVEVDESFVGGRTRGEGQGRHHKALVLGVVELMPRAKVSVADPNVVEGQRPKHQGGHGRSIIAGRLRLQIIPNRKKETLESVVLANVQNKAEVRTDGWNGYESLNKLGYRHKAVSICGDYVIADQHLPMIHIVFGNLDSWLLGTHHGVSPAHLQGYLNEFVFRFNRRFWPMVGFESLLNIAVQTSPTSERDIYDNAKKGAKSSNLR